MKTNKTPEDILRMVRRLHRTHTNRTCDDWPDVGSTEYDAMVRSLVDYLDDGQEQQPIHGKIYFKNTPPTAAGEWPEDAPLPHHDEIVLYTEGVVIHGESPSLPKIYNKHELQALPQDEFIAWQKQVVDYQKWLRTQKRDQELFGRLIKTPQVIRKESRASRPSDAISKAALDNLTTQRARADIAELEKDRLRIEEAAILNSVKWVSSESVLGISVLEGKLAPVKINQAQADQLLAEYGKLPVGLYYAVGVVRANGRSLSAGCLYSVSYQREVTE